MFRRGRKSSRREDVERGFDSPDLEAVELNDGSSKHVKKTATFEDGTAPQIRIEIGSSTTPLLNDGVENEVESPESLVSTPSSRTSRILGTAEQVSRMQTQSIYRFLNPSSEAVARDMKNEMPVKIVPSIVGSIRSRKRTMPRVKSNSTSITKDDVSVSVEKLRKRYGFQRDNARNIADYVLFLLDSRTSRMGDAEKGVITLHADYIGGENANYKTWYFNTFAKEELEVEVENSKSRIGELEMELGVSRTEAVEELHQDIWRTKMRKLSNRKMLDQICLWFLIWGESSNIRFMPELLCFIYKVAVDYNGNTEQPDGWFLANIIQPIYDFYSDQVKQLAHRRDAGSVVGYDDINEFFRDPSKIKKLRTSDGRFLWDASPAERLRLLSTLVYENTFKKTFYESRTWLHMVVNYNRVIILHVVTFLWYLVIATPFLFNITETPEAAASFPRTTAMIAMMGFVGTGISITATLGEAFFLPWRMSLWRRIGMRAGSLLIGVAIQVPLVHFLWNDYHEQPVLHPGGYALAAVCVVCSLVSTIYLVCIPTAKLNTPFKWTQSTQEKANAKYMYNFPSMSWENRAVSLVFWIITYSIKFAASYYYLAQVQATPMAQLWLYASNCARAPDSVSLCSVFGWITLGIFVLLLLCLHFLDTYIWYTLSLTLWGFWVNLRRGITLWAPWREAFSRLPKRIYANLVASSFYSTETKGKSTRRSRSLATAEIWNSIIISMYNNHLLSTKEMTKLLYEVGASEDGQQIEVNEPRYFIAQEDSGAQTAGLWGSGDAYTSEVSRRLSFFAHSISMTMPEPVPVQNMPSFTVLIPHYGERMLLSLTELIKVSDTTSDITLLEYLKFLYPKEWSNFVMETRLLEEEQDDGEANEENQIGISEKSRLIENDLINAVGFKRVDPKYVMRTRIWASLRTQTLYRTIDGFFNYYKALKILYRAESGLSHSSEDDLEAAAHDVASRKFRLLVAMQRYQKFTPAEKEAIDTLFEIFPDIQVAYLDEVQLGSGKNEYYSCLVDGHCTKDDRGIRIPRFRIKLPGWPILGDGKSDNQNHSIIFSRGEFLQVIDANQDHYLEECFKIRNLLGEFEYETHGFQNPYISTNSRASALNRQAEDEASSKLAPVAIVGTREHIFSNGEGVLADVTAGKEFVFGTLIQRMLTILGGRLHYGHPDFLNAVWLLPRGGVSKAQRSLNLNEDIFGGMNAFMRGGRIKHTEYVQCGKGRDLGFVAIINFLSKLSLGVGEQILTREHYIFGSHLSIDRFFTFFFGHVGFFIQNAISVLALVLYGMVALAATTLDAHTRWKCEQQGIEGGFCDLVERWDPRVITSWLTTAFYGILVATALSSTPLLLQLLTENGLADAISRVLCQVSSLSPVFEVFATTTYGKTLVDNIKYGGASYIATGRAMATSRTPFRNLFGRFSRNGVKFGLSLLSVTFALVAHRFGGASGEKSFPVYSVLFAVIGLSLTLAPWLFNFHQFDIREYMLDYSDTLKFFFNGHALPDSKPTWSAVVYQTRRRLTTRPDRFDWMAYLRVSWLENIGLSVFRVVFYCLLYAFCHPSREEDFFLSLKEMAILSGIVTGINFAVVMVLGSLAFLSGFFNKNKSASKEHFGQALSRLGYGTGVVVMVGLLMVLWLLDGLTLVNTIFGITAISEIQNLQYLVLCALMPPDLPTMASHVQFWTGGWPGVQAMRFFPEVLFKSHELFIFAVDFLQAHVILLLLLPFCFIPVIDQLHAFMILWIRPRFMNWNRALKKVALRRQRPWTAGVAAFSGFIAGTILFLGLFILPILLPAEVQPLVNDMLEFFKLI